MQSTQMMGENGYILTSFQAAYNYLEKMKSDKLSGIYKPKNE